MNVQSLSNIKKVAIITGILILCGSFLLVSDYVNKSKNEKITLSNSVKYLTEQLELKNHKIESDSLNHQQQIARIQDEINSLKKQNQELSNNLAKCESEKPDAKTIEKRKEENLRQQQWLINLKHRVQLLSDFFRKNQMCESLKGDYDDTPMGVNPDKASVILKYKNMFPNITNFVETGTLYGDTVQQMLPHFPKIYSVELQTDLYEHNVKKFSAQIKKGQVTLYKGDSTEELPKILETLDGPALFWLDGHFSSGPTARGLISVLKLIM